jgi:3-deoxy-manno-octulosonate cytidylyltransferase (CMP-KDO synthetase)
MQMKTEGVIPARFGSTRFPGKPLAPIAGKPMIQWVYERASRANQLDEVLVATDDERILEAVRRFGGKACMTSRNHRCGTERLAEVAGSRPAELYVNIQGDEPLLNPSDLDALVVALKDDSRADMTTLKYPIASPEDVADPNVVKVVTDAAGFALYFSRSPVPYCASCGESRPAPRHFKHIGVYGYRRAILLRLAGLAPSVLEQTEGLEQLRALENGVRMRVVLACSDTISVDRPEDIERAAHAVRNQTIQEG